MLWAITLNKNTHKQVYLMGLIWKMMHCCRSIGVIYRRQNNFRIIKGRCFCLVGLHSKGNSITGVFSPVATGV